MCKRTRRNVGTRIGKKMQVQESIGKKVQRKKKRGWHKVVKEC